MFSSPLICWEFTWPFYAPFYEWLRGAAVDSESPSRLEGNVLHHWFSPFMEIIHLI